MADDEGEDLAAPEEVSGEFPPPSSGRREREPLVPSFAPPAADPESLIHDPRSADVLRTTINAATAPDIEVVGSLRPPPLGELRHGDRYTIEGELGEGGIGRVYLARDTHLGRQVAVKELLEELRTARGEGQTPVELRFVNEARITGQLEHPGIVPVYELGRRDDDSVYYTMRLVRGRTLEEALGEADVEGRLELLPHVVDLCNTMAYAHSRGVIHRDLKPENVMLGDFGETVVLDWGLAKVRGEDDVQQTALADELRRLTTDSPIKTVAGSPIGTPAYMSPEQGRGDADAIDERSDVYSLGVIVYQLCTGTIPFDGATAKAVIERVLHERPVPPEMIEPDCPAELAAIVTRAMQKDPADRYPDARALAADLNAFMTGGRVGAHRYGMLALLRRLWRRRRRSVLAVVAAIAVAGGAWWYRGVEHTRQIERVAEEQQSEAAAEAQRVFRDVAAGNLRERWLEVYAFELLSLRNPVTSDTLERELIGALGHPSVEVRRLAARTLSGVRSPRAVDALVARLASRDEGSQEVQIEIINALGVIGDPRAEEAVRAARVRAGEFGYVWTQTELAYRMIPLPEVPEGASLTADAWHTRGTAWLWKGDYESALDALNRALAADPEHVPAYVSRAIVHRHFGESDAALADYDKLLTLRPGEVRALNNRAILKRSLEDYRGALADINEVVADGSLGVRALRTRALIRRFLGDYGGALRDLEQALAMDPNDARTHAHVAAVWMWQGDIERALRSLHQAVRANDSYAYGRLLRARAHWVLGRRDEARADVDAVLALDPTDNLARRMRALLRIEAGQVDGARRDVDYCLENQCIDDESRRALRHAQRGVVLFSAGGDVDAALADVQRALVDDTRDVDAFSYHLAAAYMAWRTDDGAAADRHLDALQRRDGHLWFDQVAKMMRGETSFEHLDAVTIQPLQRCALYLAAGLVAERNGSPASAQILYARTFSVGLPDDLACVLARHGEAVLARGAVPPRARPAPGDEDEEIDERSEEGDSSEGGEPDPAPSGVPMPDGAPQEESPPTIAP